MTIEEQIMKLQTYKMYEGEDTVYVERDDVLKALKQQSCEDCISREDVLDIAKKGVLISNGSYESVCKAINELPPVTPKIQEWLESFNNDSATECFTAVQELKKEVTSE